MSEKVGRQELIAEDCRRLAKALVRQGKPAGALPYARRAVEIYTRLGHPDLEDVRTLLQECESWPSIRTAGLKHPAGSCEVSELRDKKFPKGLKRHTLAVEI